MPATTCRARRGDRTHRHRRPHRNRPSVESLEQRVLLAFALVGPEFQVNTTTAGSQFRSAVASDADGDFVVVWQNMPPSNSGTFVDVRGQRYSATGAALGTELRFGASAYFPQAPAVAMDADGDFVVAWQTYGQDGSGFGIYAQRFNAAGVPQDGEFRVNDTTDNYQTSPSIAFDVDGDFVIAWRGRGPGDDVGIFMKRYSAAGAARGGEVRVNTNVVGNQMEPVVASDADGDFMVAWHSVGQDGSGYGVYAQRFNSAGVAQGPELPVNTSIADDQRYPSMAADADGDFIITWESVSQGGAESEVYARRYSAAGVAGPEFRVNTAMANYQGEPAVAVDAAGNFVIVWSSRSVGATFVDVYGQRLSAAGLAIGGEFLINTYRTQGQWLPAVASDADGDLVVVWESRYQDGDESGIYAQRFDESSDLAGPFVTDAFVAGRRAVPAIQIPAGAAQVVLNFSERLSTTGGAAGAGSATNPANWRLTRDGADVSSAIQAVGFGYNGAKRKYEATLSLAPLLVGGAYALTARDALRDPSLNALDGNLDGAPGADYTLPFLVVNDAPTTVGIGTVSFGEDEEPAVVSLFDAFKDATDADGALAYAILSNTNPGLFSATPIDRAAGTLTLASAPDVNGSAQVTVRATDTGGRSVDATFLVLVLAVNDAPVNAVPGPQFGLPGQPLVFSAANGNAIAVSDIDGGTRGVSLTLETGDGYTMELARTDGITVSAEPRILRLSGPIANVNAALDGLQFIQGVRAESPTFLTVVTDDTGTGLGGTLRDADTIAVTFDAALVGVSIGDVTMTEGHGGATAATFTVRLTREAPDTAVRYATADGTASVAGGDYQLESGVLHFARGETQKTVTVLVNGDGFLEDDETFFMSLSDPAGLEITDGQGVGTILNDDVAGPPPAVTQVFVSGTTWTPTFKSYLAAQGMGDGTFGYAVPAGAAQLAILPWGNVNQVSVRFNKEVFVLDLDLAVRGVNVPAYPVVAFDYDDLSHTGTWTLGEGIRNDKLLLNLNGGVDGITDSGGALLDGEWSNGADAFPSGNGVAGGDLRFRLNVLAGDATQDGRVNATDWTQVRMRQRRSTTSPGAGSTGYSLFHDLNGSGVTDTTDLLYVRRNLLRVLPSPDPAPATATLATAAGRPLLIRDAFSRRGVIS